MCHSLILTSKGYSKSEPIALLTKGYIYGFSIEETINGCPIVLATKGVLGDSLSLVSKGILCPIEIVYTETSATTIIEPGIVYGRGGIKYKYNAPKEYEEPKKKKRQIKVTVYKDGEKYYCSEEIEENILLKILDVDIEYKPLPTIIIKVSKDGKTRISR